MIIVTDRMEKSDTLRPVIVVLPPNRPFTLSVSYTAALTADSSLDMSTAAGPDTLRFSIHDPDVPLVEQHTVRIVQSHTETVSAVDSSRAFMIILDPARVSASVLKDTIQVIVTDRGGHADSLFAWRRISYGPRIEKNLDEHHVRQRCGGSCVGVEVSRPGAP